jgi:hypothetical protein
MLGLQNSTSRFMVIVGRVAGFINLFLLLAAAIVFFYLGWMAVTGGEYPAMIQDNEERRKLVDSVGPWLIPLALIMILTVWKVSEMILANRQLSGIMGLAAFIKALLL